MISVVMGMTRESRQDLSSRVGMESREQVALEEARIAHRTSSAEAGEKSDKHVWWKRRIRMQNVIRRRDIRNSGAKLSNFIIKKF